MIISCPSCSTRFVVAPEAIGESGRRVRCAKCRHVWFAEPPDAEHEIVPERVIESKEGMPPEGAPARKSPDRLAEDILHRRSAEPGTQLPALREGPSHALLFGWVALVIFILGMIGSMAIWKDAIVTAWPASARLYNVFVATDMAANRAQRISYLRRTVDFSQDIEVLDRGIRLDILIRGRLVNNGTDIESLPRIQGILRDANAAQVHSWSFRLPEDQIAPGQTIEFEELVENIPREAQSAELFLLWRDLPEFTNMGS